MSKTALEIANFLLKEWNESYAKTVRPIPNEIVLAEAVVRLTEKNEGLKERLHLNAYAVKDLSQAIKEAEEAFLHTREWQSMEHAYEDAVSWLAKYGEKK